MITKYFIPLLLLLSCNAFLLNGYEVNKFLPFGKNPQDIAKNIKLLAAQKVKLIDAINSHFHTQEKEIINKLKTKYRISEADWKASQQFYEQMVANDPLYKKHTGTIIHGANDHTIVKKARELLVGCGMNPQAIKFVDTPEFGPAAVVTTLDNNNNNKLVHTMHLNIKELSALSEAEYSNIIKHELMHLWYGDSLRSMFVLNFIGTNTTFDKEPLLGDYCKNSEMRADIMSLIHTTKHIPVLSGLFKKYLWTDQYKDPSHPSFAERIDALKQLATYVNEAKKYPAIAA